MGNEVMIDGVFPVAKQDIQLMLEAGYLYMELGKNTEAEEIFLGVSALIPHSEIPHTALGNLYFSMGRFSQALKAHQKAVEKKPDSSLAYASIGESYLFLNKSAEGMEALDKAIALDPEGSSGGAFASHLKEAYKLGVFG